MQAFGNYRGAAPTQTVTDRDFTGQPQNRAVGLLYYQARFYVPSIGRFASADTIVPDPTNPQQYNRYSYVLNNPLRYSDPTGHSCYNPSSGSPCTLSDGTGNSSSGLPASSSPPSQTSAPQHLTPIFDGLPVASENMVWANGFGANSYAKSHGSPNGELYNSDKPIYAKSAGIHPGLDFSADGGAKVVSNVSGTVLMGNSNPYPGDAPPNIVILVTPNEDGKCGICVVFSHVNAIAGLSDGQSVIPGVHIGTVVDQGPNSHVHLALREGTQVVHNPINYFIDPSDLNGIPWSGYPNGESLYSISSYKLPPANALYNFWSDGEVVAGVVRP